MARISWWSPPVFRTRASNAAITSFSPRASRTLWKACWHSATSWRGPASPLARERSAWVIAWTFNATARSTEEFVLGHWPNRRCLTAVRFAHPAQQIVQQDYIHAVQDAEARL